MPITIEDWLNADIVVVGMGPGGALWGGWRISKSKGSPPAGL